RQGDQRDHKARQDPGAKKRKERPGDFHVYRVFHVFVTDVGDHERRQVKNRHYQSAGEIDSSDRAVSFLSGEPDQFEDEEKQKRQHKAAADAGRAIEPQGFVVVREQENVIAEVIVGVAEVIKSEITVERRAPVLDEGSDPQTNAIKQRERGKQRSLEKH